MQARACEEGGPCAHGARPVAAPGAASRAAAPAAASAPATAVQLCMLHALCFAALRAAPPPHPYLLADNRHFTFYIWRRLLAVAGVHARARMCVCVCLFMSVCACVCCKLTVLQHGACLHLEWSSCAAWLGATNDAQASNGQRQTPPCCACRTWGPATGCAGGRLGSGLAGAAAGHWALPAPAVGGGLAGVHRAGAGAGVAARIQVGAVRPRADVCAMTLTCACGCAGMRGALGSGCGDTGGAPAPGRARAAAAPS